MGAFERTVAYVMSGVIGLCVGSFLNVVIYRLPRGMNLSYPPSHCTTCNYRLRWYDNITVLSWLMLKGKCRNCGAPISFRYTAVEIINTLLWILCAFMFWQQDWRFAVVAMIACSVFVCVYYIDLEHKLIFDRFHVILLLLGAAACLTDDGVSPLSRLIGAVGGGAVFLLFFYGSIWILKREGLGGGDVKLVAAAGFFLGWEKLFLAVLIASVLGSVVLLIVNRKNREGRETEYPFGPFLVAGMLTALLFGSQLINWYLGLLGG